MITGRERAGILPVVVEITGIFGNYMLKLVISIKTRNITWFLKALPIIGVKTKQNKTKTCLDKIKSSYYCHTAIGFYYLCYSMAMEMV